MVPLSLLLVQWSPKMFDPQQKLAHKNVTLCLRSPVVLTFKTHPLEPGSLQTVTKSNSNQGFGHSCCFFGHISSVDEVNR